MDQQELIVFIHIAKTGGTTLRSVLQAQYQKQSIFLYLDKTNKKRKNEEKIIHLLQKYEKQAKVISGHFGFDIKYEEITKPILPRIQTQKKIVYLSMMRNPVDRIFSLFHHYQRNAWLSPEVTFEIFVMHQLYTLNQQTLYISGGEIPNIQQAKRNIVHHFGVIGVTDMYRESLFVMKERFHWDIVSCKKEGVFVNPKELQYIPIEIVQQIEKDNALDCELYRFVRWILKKKIKQIQKAKRKEWNTFFPFSE